jgi:GntR family transcriptional regulator/MocR family aminotransferase
VRRAPRARLACVTASNQHPLGGALPLPTRLALLEWATRAGAWVIEDDYDSEYRYVGRPLMSLQGLDCTGRVLYVGTFSKTLTSALRLGFLVVPPGLLHLMPGLCLAAGSSPPLLEQAVLTDFMVEGHFARHVRRMRALYDRRQQYFRGVAREMLGGLLDVPPIEAGMRLVGHLPPGVDDHAVRDAAAARGVIVESLSMHYLGPSARQGLLLGFAGYGPRTTRTAMGRLAEAIDAVARGRAR